MTVAVEGSTVTVTGEVDFANRDELFETLLPLAARGEAVVVDVRDIEFMDSSGVTALVQARRIAAENGGSFVVLASQVVHRALTVLALDTLLGLASDEA